MSASGGAVYSDEDIQEKLSNLTPEMQAAFLNATKDLFHWESDFFLKIISDSRNEITETENDEDAENLRSMSAKMEMDRKRKEQLRLRALGGTAAINYESEHDKAAVESYLKAVGRQRTDISTSSYARPVSAKHEAWDNARPGTSYKMRVGDNEMEDDEPERPMTMMQHKDEVTIIKEKDLLLERLKSQGEIALSERQRQMNLIQKKKDERKEKKKGVHDRASAMISETNDVDNIQQKNQERQQQLVQDRLEKKRQQREKTMENLRMQSITQDDIDSAMSRRRSIRLESLTAADLEEGSALKKALSSLQLNETVEDNEDDVSSPRISREHKSKEKRKSSRSKSQPRSLDMEEGAGASENDRMNRITKMFEVDETKDTPVSPRPNEEKRKKKKKKKREISDSEV